MQQDTIGRRARASDWCILRTSPGRTLALAKSLFEAGLDVWTPKQTHDRRRPRSTKTVQIEAPIMPTFVFARAILLPELMRLRSLEASPHPGFSIFQHMGRTPLIADREITNLRVVEEIAIRARLKKSERYVFPAGQKVSVAQGNFVGLEGVVEGGDGNFALVCFGGAMQFKIATFLLRTDEVQAGAARMGIAA
jgi:transcription antitermination factor NusG